MKTHITFIIFFLLLCSVSCGMKSNDKESSKGTSLQEVINYQADMVDLPTAESGTEKEPMTFDFFSEVYNNENQIAYIVIEYRMQYNDENPDARTFYSDIVSSRVRGDGYSSDFIGQDFNDIEIWNSYYEDSVPGETYRCILAYSLLKPLFDILNDSPDYFFNASEFNGEPSKKIIVNTGFGHVCLFSLDIYLSDHNPPNEVTKTICKGWDPGEEPPAELSELLFYLDTVILPEMENHPEFP